MFGRVRAPWSPPDTLERPPSKIIKDDPLSIYEATLIKLKLGSRRQLSSPAELEETDSASMSSPQCSADLSSPSPESPHCTFCAGVSKCQCLEHDSPSEDSMVIDSDCSSDYQSTSSSKEQRSRNASVLYLFSKFNDSRRAPRSSLGAMVVETENASPGVSGSSDCQSLSSST